MLFRAVSGAGGATAEQLPDAGVLVGLQSELGPRLVRVGRRARVLNGVNHGTNLAGHGGGAAQVPQVEPYPPGPCFILFILRISPDSAPRSCWSGPVAG